MCVIVLGFQVRTDLPLVIAANRDEFYARRSEPPVVLVESPRVVGGRDAELGGTWMGFTPGGFFAGLTNRRTLGPPEPARRSRGEVVTAALSAGAIGAVEAYLAGLDGREFNPFNLVFGDATALRVASATAGEQRIRVEPLAPGLHAVANGSPGERTYKVQRALGLAQPLMSGQRAWSDLEAGLRRLLADQAMPPLEETPDPPPWLDRAIVQRLQAICVHTPVYGTRSSTIAAIGPERVMHYSFAAGPPTGPIDSQADFTDVTELLTGLLTSA
jgi:uncharacterized protein with NRDE domain